MDISTVINKSFYIFCTLLVYISPAFAAEPSIEPYNVWIQKANIPDFVKEVFTEKKLTEKYDFSFHINPCYLRGDFDGDKQNDIGILIKERKSGKLGIAICHYGKKDVFIIGAGTAIGNGGTDFKWMDVWFVYPKSKVHSPEETAPLQLLGEGLFVEKGESASGLIYWDGKSYKWYQMSD